jgi:hypothetical protein
MNKRIVFIGKDVYEFSKNSNSSETGMLIEKNNEFLGIYPNFEYGDNLDDNYLIELALEFENEN